MTEENERKLKLLKFSNALSGYKLELCYEGFCPRCHSEGEKEIPVPESERFPSNFTFVSCHYDDAFFVSCEYHCKEFRKEGFQEL